MTTSGLLRRTGHLAGGSAVGQAVALLSAPVLARVYGPDEFGTLAAFSSLGLLLASISALRYEAGIPLAESDGMALALLRLSVVLTTVVAAAIGVTAWSLRPWLPGSAWVGGIAWPLLLPFAILPVGLYQAYSGWAVRRSATRVLGRTRVCQSGVAVGSQLALSGLAGGVGLLLGEVIGRVVGIGALRRLVRRDTLLSVPPSAAELRRAATTYRPLARYLLPATLASAAAVHLPIVVTPSMFGAAEGGSLYLVVRVGMAPSLLLGTAVGQVLLGDLGGGSDLAPARLQAERIFSALVAIYLPVYGAVAASAPLLATTVLGTEWTQAGQVARQLSPLLLTWSVASPLSVLLLVGRRESETFVMSLLDLAARTAAILSGWAVGSFPVAMVAYGVVGGAVGTVSVVRSFRAVGAPLRPAVARMRPAALVGLSSAAASWALTIAPIPTVLRVAGIGVVAVVGAGAASIVTIRRSRTAPTRTRPCSAAEVT